MKTKIVLLVFIFTLTCSTMPAQKLIVDTQKSSIKWLGKKIGGQHEGNILLKSGSFKLKNDQFVSGGFIVDMTTISNTDIKKPANKQKLVRHLKSDNFFGVEKYPTAKFTITQSTKLINGKATITGNITIKGKTESITFDVIKKVNQYTTKIDLDRSKFNIRHRSNSFFDNLGDKAIDDVFTLNIKLVAK